MMRVGEHREDLVQRVRVLRGALAVLLCAVAGSFWFTQLVRGDYYRELAENNRLRKLPVRAPRGLIYDRLGRPLVENVPSYFLLFDRGRSADIQSSTVRCPSRGTMMPPTPSMKSGPFAPSIAIRLNLTSSSKSMRRPSRAAARSGDSGARKRQGAI